MTQEQYEKYILWLKDEVYKRTVAVVGGNLRKGYYKAAMLIIALGQTLESNGVSMAERDLISHYRKTFSGRTAFKSEIVSLKN